MGAEVLVHKSESLSSELAASLPNSKGVWPEQTKDIGAGALERGKGGIQMEFCATSSLFLVTIPFAGSFSSAFLKRHEVRGKAS